MNKKAIISGVAVLLICVGLCGCNEEENDEFEQNTNKYFFTLTVEIDNYHSNIILGYSIQMGGYDNDIRKELLIPKDENRKFDVNLETGYDNYFVLAYYYYDYDIYYDNQIDQAIEKYQNPQNKNMKCKTIIDKYGELSLEMIEVK